MGFIYSDSFVDVASGSITVGATPGTLTGYAAVNVFDRWHYARSWRSDANFATLTPGGSGGYGVFTYNFGAAQTVAAVVLLGCNWNKFFIYGNATDVWTSPSYSSGVVTATLNSKTGRPHYYKALTAFNYQYMKIYIDYTASALGDYTTKAEVNKVCVLSSVTTMSKGTSYGYTESVEQFYRDIDLSGGHSQRISHGTHKRWTGTLNFGPRLSSNETELWTFGEVDISQPFIFYANQGDATDVYLCLRDDNYQSTSIARGIVQGNQIRLREMI